MIIYYDEKYSVLDIVYLIRLNSNFTLPKQTEEYSELSFKEISKVKDIFHEESVVNTSKILLNFL